MIDPGWNRFDAATIDAQPTPVACLLHELSGTDQALLALWRACDLVELQLRLAATILFAELAQREDAARLAAEVLRKSEFKYWVPTLGMWRRLLDTLAARAELRDSVLAELVSRPGRRQLAGFFDGAQGGDSPRYEKSFSSLRNRLAHGAGLTNDAAAHLLALWHGRIREFVDAQLAWLAHFEFEGRGAGPSDPVYRLRGLVPGPVAAPGAVPALRPASGASGGSDAGTPGPEEVWASRGGVRLQLWPLVAFGVPRVPPRKVDVLATQVYANVGGSERHPRIFYSPYVHVPVGRSMPAIYWCQGDDRGRDRLLAIFRPAAEAAPAAVPGWRHAGATGEFRGEMHAEGRRMMGRTRELRVMLNAVDEHRGGALWLHGPAGIGKSSLMAKAAQRLLERGDRREAPRGHAEDATHAEDSGHAGQRGQRGQPGPIVVLYRFRYADPRCNGDRFLDLALATLLDGGGDEGLPPLAAGQEAAERQAIQLARLEARLRALSAAGRDAVFVVDGLDEIASTDDAFLDKVLFRLLRLAPAGAGRATWLLSGRSHLTPSVLRAGARALAFGDDGGVPGLEEKDVWAMLLDRIGSARADLFRGTDDEARRLPDVPGSAAMVAELAQGRIPRELLDTVKGADWVADPDQPARAVERATHAGADGDGREWLLDDDADTELYFATWRPARHAFELRASRLSSPFIDALVRNARADREPSMREAGGTDRADRTVGTAASDGARPSKCLALYVKYVVDDILAGQVGHTNQGAFDPAWLPDGLTRYYDGMMKRLNVGGVAGLLTDLVYLLAAAREPLDAASLVALLADKLPRRANAATRLSMVSDAIDALRSVLRERTRPDDGAPTWTLYHHSFREYLLPDTVRGGDAGGHDPFGDSLAAGARACLADACAAAVATGLAGAGPLAGYVGRHGIGHLLDDGDYANAVGLAARLLESAGRDEGETAGPGSGALRTQVNQLAEALRRATGDEDEAPADLAEQIAAIEPEDLVRLIASTYETGLNVPAIRILIEHHSGGPESAWARAGRELVSPYDIVFRHDVGEAYAALWRAAAPADQGRWMADIEAMAADARDDYRREIAGYALKHVYDAEPGTASAALIARFACGPAIADRMVAGELLLTLAVRRRLVGLPDAAADFWRPRWAYLACDVDTLRVLMADDPAALAADQAEPALAACAREHLDAQALAERLRGVAPLAASRTLRPLLGSAADQFESADRLEDPELADELATLLDGVHRGHVVDFLRMLASHPLWNVAEEVSALLRRIVTVRPHLGSVIDELLVDARWRVRYAAIDAAYNVGPADGYRRFRDALVANAMHPHGRVRGICADDLLGWLRFADRATRLRILRDEGIRAVLTDWLRVADDSWLLEYVYLIFRFLREDAPTWDEGDVASLLAGPRTPYLRGRRPFHTYAHPRFMRLIDRLRRRHARAGLASAAGYRAAPASLRASDIATRRPDPAAPSM